MLWARSVTIMVERTVRNRIFRGFNSVDAIKPQTQIFDIELVKRDLLNHFHTSRGERVMRPNFGSLIWDLLFEPFDEDTREAIISDVEAVTAQETRVILQGVDITEFEHGLRLDITVLYEPLGVFGTFEIEFDRRNQTTSQSSTIIEDLI